MLPLNTLSKIASAFALILMTAAPQTYAQSDRRGPPGGAPEEAITACSNLSEGDACSFEGRRNDTVEGSCMITPDEALACAPEGGPPGRGKGRPE